MNSKSARKRTISTRPLDSFPGVRPLKPSPNGEKGSGQETSDSSTPAYVTVLVQCPVLAQCPSVDAVTMLSPFYRRRRDGMLFLAAAAAAAVASFNLSAQPRRTASALVNRTGARPPPLLAYVRSGAAELSSCDGVYNLRTAAAVAVAWTTTAFMVNSCRCVRLCHNGRASPRFPATICYNLTTNLSSRLPSKCIPFSQVHCLSQSHVVA